MKRLSRFSMAIITALLFLVTPFQPFVQGGEVFSVRQYETFHEVLHPLEHEALPRKDFQRIRSKAMELFRLGKKIVKLGVPRGTAAEQVEESKQQLKKFSAALDRFRSDARAGTDEQLMRSYSAVHDSFEMLAGMLPRRRS